MAEMVGGREGAEDVRVVGAAAGQGVEGFELPDDHVAVPAEAFELTARQKQRLRAHERTEMLVHRRRDDQVDLAELVLEEHEDDTVRGRRPLARDRHSGHHEDPQLVKCLGGGSPAQGLARPGIKRRGHGREGVRAVRAQVSALREVLPQQPIGILVRAALPWAVRIAEVDLHASIDPQLRVLAISAP